MICHQFHRCASIEIVSDHYSRKSCEQHLLRFHLSFPLLNNRDVWLMVSECLRYEAHILELVDTH